MIRILDAQDLQAIEPLRLLVEAIDKDQDVAVLDALLQIEAVRQHLRDKYYGG